jgi:hypothetical protein
MSASNERVFLCSWTILPIVELSSVAALSRRVGYTYSKTDDVQAILFDEFFKITWYVFRWKRRANIATAEAYPRGCLRRRRRGRRSAAGRSNGGAPADSRCQTTCASGTHTRRSYRSAKLKEVRYHPTGVEPLAETTPLLRGFDNREPPRYPWSASFRAAFLALLEYVSPRRLHQAAALLARR